MSESTARAERFEAQSSTGPFYAWEVSQKPVSVRMPFAVIDRLEHEAVESFRSLTSRGSEVGGLLLGSASAGLPTVVLIEDYELITCDYSRGPLYHLADADLVRFERAMEQHNAGPGPRVVGFFRSHTRKGLGIDADDLVFLEARFRDPRQVALLIRPFATKASVGGIFIWEDGVIHGDASYLEFPFRSADLAPAKGIPEALDVAPAAPQTPAPAPKAATRAQIVPIASRRDIGLPPVEPLPIKPVEAERPVETPSLTPPRMAQIEEKRAPEKAAKIERPAKPEKPAVEKAVVAEKPAAIEKPPVVEKPAPLVERVVPEPSVPWDTPPAQSGSGKKIAWILASVAVLALAGVFLFVYPGVLMHQAPPRAVAVAPQDPSPLKLRVERTARELLLTWNREAEPIRNAKKAVLSISDGERHENYDMDASQLHNGSIVYSPVTNDVSFKLDVTDQNLTRTTSESVRALLASPMPDDPQKTAKAPAKANAAQNDTPVPEPAQTARPTMPVKPFNVASLAERLRPARSSDIPEAPALGRGEGEPAVNLNSVVSSSSPIGAPSASVPAAPVPERKASTTAQGGRISQAELIYRKSPDYPRIAMQAGAKGIVVVQATIGADGKVKAAKVVRGHPMLQRAAIDAVMQWKYKPTMLNGAAVESQTNIELNFVGQ